MVWRTAIISRDSTLTLRQGNLACQQGDELVILPVEDLAVLVLESHQIMVSNALLAKLQDAGTVVITCDDKHTPNGLLLPFHQHSRLTEVAFLQKDWSTPFTKRCWQNVVEQKIKNQAYCLEKCGRDGSKTLKGMASRVQSGDSANMEAQAARAYWDFLFGDAFRRGKADIINAALNYGYAIARATVARAVVAHGLLPCFGMFHNNKLNAFNLVDDLLEPWRPLVDYSVVQMNLLELSEFTTDHRRQLATLPGSDCAIGGQVQTLLRGAEEMVASLVSATRDKTPQSLRLPTFAL